MIFAPFYKIVPNGNKNGLPLRGDYARELVAAILKHYNTNVRGKPISADRSRKHRKKPTRPQLMTGGANVVDFAQSAAQTLKIKTRPLRNCNTKVIRKAHNRLADSVARTMHAAFDACEGWVSTIWEWLSSHRNFATKVEVIKQNFALNGNTVVFLQREFEKPKIQQRTGIG